MLKLKLVLIFYVLICAMFLPILCQNKNIAIVSNLTLNGKFNRNSLDQLTLLLNMDNDINVVIIFGSTSEIKSSDEWNQMQLELAKLKIPYQVIVNENDFLQTEDFFLDDNEGALIGINSIKQKQIDLDFIKIESLNKISSEQDLNKFNKVYLFTNNSLDRIQNSSYLLTQLNNKYLFSFYPTEKKFSAQLNSKIKSIDFEIPPSLANDAINYFILKEYTDTIKVLKRTDKSELLENVYSVSQNDLKKIDISIEEQKIDSSLNKIFEIEYKSSSWTQTLIADNRLYAVLDNGLIYLIDFKGKEKFVTELIGNIKNNPALYKDLILASTFEGDLYSINSNNGEILQVVGIGENIITDISFSDVEIQNTKKICGVFGTLDGNIFCYDAFTFEQVWKNHISKFSLVSKPLLVNDKIIFTNSNSSLYCVNSKSGAINWRFESANNEDLSLRCRPLSDGKNIFTISPDGNLYAVDVLLGKKNWAVSVKGMLNQIYLSSDNEKLFLFDSNGLMIIYSSKDGKEIRKIDFKKSNLFSFIITEMQDKILVGFSDGSLYSFDSSFIQKQLISADQIPINSINIINKNEFVIKNINGKITMYKIQ
jgi:outer membrane protein assembly factor BamB